MLRISNHITARQLSRVADLNRTRSRSGYLYVGVLIVSAIVSIIGFASLTIARAQLRNVIGTHDAHRVRLLAQSGVELGLSQINNDPAWQTTFSPGTEYPGTPVSANGGTFTWRTIDNSGDWEIEGIGRVGDVQCRYRVAIGGTATTLQHGLLVGGTLTIGSNETLVVTNSDTVSNTSVTNSGTLTTDLEAQSFTNTGTYTGTSSVPGVMEEVPDDSILDYYTSTGTVIGNGLLDDGGGGLIISGKLLSPFSNPFGSTDPDGIYVIDADGKKLTIENSRIVATIAVTNCLEVEISGSVCWEPAYSNNPAILVQGPLRCKFDDTDLLESDQSVNFNPAGTPWQGGTDIDIVGSYPSELVGIVFCSGDLIFDGENAVSAWSPKLTGVVICAGNCSCINYVNAAINHDGTFDTDPAPGFVPVGDTEIDPGSWRRVASQ